MERMCGWRASSRTPHRPLRGEMAQALQHDSAGIEGDALGPKRGETLGDDVGIYELRTAKAPARTSAAAVVLPAPLGPATTTRLGPGVDISWDACPSRSEEHTSELQSL